jgi:hypothetical protein
MAQLEVAYFEESTGTGFLAFGIVKRELLITLVLPIAVGLLLE